MNSNQTVASGYGTECPVCHGTGWELITRAIEGDPAHTFARPCQKCRGGGAAFTGKYECSITVL